VTTRQIDGLFPTPVAVVDFEGYDVDQVLYACKSYKDWRPVDGSVTPMAFSSNDLSVLTEFPELKNLLMEEISRFGSSTLGYPDDCLQMTTSWFTKTLPGGSSAFHVHRNSLLSGCFYLDGGPDFAPISFLNKGSFDGGLLVDPVEPTIYHQNEILYDGKEGRLLIFPSNLPHRVCMHNAVVPRYSIAFNTIFTGSHGVGDSSVSLTLNDHKFTVDRED